MTMFHPNEFVRMQVTVMWASLLLLTSQCLRLWCGDTNKQDQPPNWTPVKPSNKNNGTSSRTFLAKLSEMNRVLALLHCVMSAAFCPRAQRNYYCLRLTSTALTLNRARPPLSSGKPWTQNISIISKSLCQCDYHTSFVRYSLQWGWRQIYAQF